MALGEMNSGNESTGAISWTAQIKCATWCRLCKVKSQYNIIGTSFIFNYAATRVNVVYNETLMINTNHSKRASVNKLGASHYAQTKIRIISDSSGDCFVEVQDESDGATSSTQQQVNCALVPIRCGEITPYENIVDGTTVPSGFGIGTTVTCGTMSYEN